MTKHLVILNYKKPNKSPHYAVLKEINENYITLMDPDFGPNYKYNLNQFDWSGGIKTPTTKALIAIRYN
jgi:predicted double-glycine peptidase